MNYVYFRTGIFLLLSTLFATIANAQESLYVHTMEGKQQSFLLGGIDKLTFPGEDMLITFNSVPSKSYSIADIDYCNFKFIPHWHRLVGPYYDVSIFPNPTDNEFSIESTIEISEITVLDIVGRKIMQVVPTSAITNLQLGNYANGVYIIQIMTAQGPIGQKIIKTK